MGVQLVDLAIVHYKYIYKEDAKRVFNLAIKTLSMNKKMSSKVFFNYDLICDDASI